MPGERETVVRVARVWEPYRGEYMYSLAEVLGGRHAEIVTMPLSLWKVYCESRAMFQAVRIMMDRYYETGDV